MIDDGVSEEDVARLVAAERARRERTSKKRQRGGESVCHNKKCGRRYTRSKDDQQYCSQTCSVEARPGPWVLSAKSFLKGCANGYGSNER